MQKAKVICLILAVVLASAGTVSVAMNMSGETVAPIVPNNALDTVMDKPTEGTPADNSAIENLFIAQGELQRKGGFVGTTTGTAVSAGIAQNVYNNRVVIGGNAFKEMITVGIVKNAYQLYISDGNYLHRNYDNIKSETNIKWSDTASRYSEEGFLEKFGHCSNTLTGYILNEETVVSGALEKEENGLFTYRYVLNTETAPARMLYEMKTNSNMSGFSTFTKAEIIVTMDADWQVKSLTTDCKYKVPMFGGVNCVEDVTEIFSDLTSNELPETEFFKQFFDASIVDKPVDKDPDALSLLMDIFSPYIGDNNLNVSLTAAMDGQTVLNGLVSAKIDIENIANIEVAAKIGDELFVEYQQGALFVTYQDFKASTTVDGIMGLVNALMPKSDTSVDGEANEEEDNDILSRFTFVIQDDLCTVSLPLEVGGEQLNVIIYANVVDGKYEFRNAEVTFSSLKLDIEPISEFDMPAREGEYPEILGLLDLVKNGVIYGNVNAFGMDVDVMFDLASVSLYATSGNLAVTYKDNTIYAELGAIKAKLNLRDIDKIISLLRVAGVIDGNASLELPQISIEKILAILGDIQATATDNGVAFRLSMDDLSVVVYLVSVTNGWNVDKITAEYNGNVITLAVAQPTLETIPEVNACEYADVMDVITTFIDPLVSLATAKGYGASFALTLTIDSVAYNVEGSFTYDAANNINVAVTVSNSVATLIKADVTVADGVVYLDVNGLKTAFDIGEMNADIDLTQIIGAISGVNDKLDGIVEAVGGIVNRVVNIDIAAIDFANIVKQFSFVNGVLDVTVNADFIGLSDINVQLSVNNKGNLVVAIDGLQLDCLELSAQAAVVSNPRKVAVPSADDYILNLAGSVSDIEFAVSADLLHMDIYASVQAFDQTVLARYIDGKVYLSVGEIAVMGTISELGALVEYITSAVGIELNAIDLDSFANVDLSIENIINAISIDLDGTLSLGLNLDGIANVSVNFDSEANFVGITADAMGYRLQITSNEKQVEKLDIDKVYIPVESLAKHAVDIYNSFKDIVDTGIAANLETNLNVNGNDYLLSVIVNYNNGLHLGATLSDNANVLVCAEIYLVNNVLYADINGVRAAYELPETDKTSNANVDIAAVVGMLAQAKGYNDTLDSVIAVVEGLPAKLEGINYLDLLSKLTYDNGVLNVGVNGEMLGMSDFELTVAGTQELTATLTNLCIGNVTVASLEVILLPACGEVTAPTSEYVTELQVEVMGLAVTAKLDLYNKTVVAKTTLLGHELGAYYIGNTVYVSYGAVNAKLDIADIDKLIAVISMFVDGGIPSVDMPELDVKQILDSLSKVATDNGYELSVAIAGVNVTLSFDSNAKLVSAKVNLNDIDVTALLISGATYPVFDINADYVDLAALAEAFASDVHNVMNAEGYCLTLNGNFVFDNNVYGVVANVIYDGGLYVNANVYYNSANIVDIELWLVDNTLYVSMGDLKLAFGLSQSNSAQGGSDKIDLTAYKGYNHYIDGILDVVQSVIDKFAAGNVDYIALIDSLTFTNDVLTLSVNGEQLGLSNIEVLLNANDGISVNMSNLAIDKMTANLNASVKASNNAVVAPKGDFTTNLSIKIDDKNTIYANLDLINGVYNFRLDDLYAMYADNIIYINKGDIYVSGNINDIKDYVKQIDDLVNDFSGATESTIAKIDFDMFSNIDVKAIVNSLAIKALGDTATVSASALGFDVQVKLADGQLRKVTVPVSLIDKTLEVEPCSAQTLDKFNGEHDYIQIEQVFNDYFPAFERLVHTNSWKFNFDGDAMLSIGKNAYKVAAGSYFEFYYKNTEGMDTFKLRARLDVHKQKADGKWQPYMNIDIVYKDGNIYVTDKGRLVDNKKEESRNTIKLTVSVKTLIKCYDLYDEIVAVVPQIGELVDSMMNAMKEAEGNAENISYSTILNDVSYVEGLFGIDLNGASLLSKLGAITLSAQTYGEGLSLNALELTYDTISLQVSNLRVYASEVVEVNGEAEYATVQDINAYDTSGHMDFNSLYELLSAFVATATPIDNSNTRSFYIDGTATVSLKIIGLNVADIDMGLAVKVDINEDNKVYISTKITRTKPSGIGTAFVDVYNDKGGDSYLYYDGVNETFTVIRNSIIDYKYTVQETQYKWHCTKCDKDTGLNAEWCAGTHWEGWKLVTHGKDYLVKVPVIVDKEVTEKNYYYVRHYAAENITSADFTANIMDYILELFNFGSTIKDPIVKAMQEPNNNDYGIEDILKDYSYSEEQKVFALNADLTPIDSNLGPVDIGIYHDVNFNLTNLNVNVELLNGMCKAKVPFELQASTYGDATNLVQQVIFW